MSKKTQFFGLYKMKYETCFSFSSHLGLLIHLFYYYLVLSYSSLEKCTVLIDCALYKGYHTNFISLKKKKTDWKLKSHAQMFYIF